MQYETKYLLPNSIHKLLKLSTNEREKFTHLFTLTVNIFVMLLIILSEEK